MNNRLTNLTSTDQGSRTDLESKTEGAVATAPVMRFHPTPTPTNKPLPVGEEQIEGAQGTSYAPTIASGHPSNLPMPTLEVAPRDATDEAFAAERCYGNPDNANDDVDNHDVVIKQTSMRETRRSWTMMMILLMMERTWQPKMLTMRQMMVTKQRRVDEPAKVDEPAEVNKPAKVYKEEQETDNPLGQRERAPVWGCLGTVSERDTTNNESGKAATMMKSILIQSPEGGRVEEEPPWQGLL